MSVSLEVPNKKLWVKSLFNKTKTEAFLENYGHKFLDVE